MIDRMPGWLFALLAAALVLYTDDYVIAGILPELARDLGVTESAAGQLVTIFSITVAVAAPIAAVVFARSPRRRLFTIALVVFVAANVAASLTPTFAFLMGLRVVAAGAAAATTPALFAFAAERAPEDRTGRYIAVVALGVTGSIAAGVPIGTWIGGQFGWRATFATMAAAGALALLALLATMPAEGRSDTAPRLREQLRILGSAPVSLGLLANCMLMTGSMMMLTYLAPYLAVTTTAGTNERALAFSLSGLAGMVGIWAGGIASDRWGPDRTLHIGIGSITVGMVGLWLLWLFGPSPWPLVIGVGAVWGGMAFWNSPAIQARLYALAGPVAPQALALNTSGTYLGVACGGAIGGLALSIAHAGVLPLVAAVLGMLALGLLALAGRAAASVAAE